MNLLSKLNLPALRRVFKPSPWTGRKYSCLRTQLQQQTKYTKTWSLAALLAVTASTVVLFSEEPENLNTFPFATLPNLILSQCAAEFPRLGLPESYSFMVSTSKEDSLDLIAAGMRRKNLYIMEVDVYTVGVYVSKRKDDAIQSTIARGVGLELSKPSPVVSKEECADLGILLHFVRDVSTSAVVDAIVQALAGPGEEYNRAVKQCHEIMASSIGNSGVKKHGEVAFAMVGHKGDALNIMVNGSYAGTVYNADLRARMVDIYTGDKAVAPAVAQIINDHYQPQQGE